MAPVSYAQRRLWFLNRVNGGSGVYNCPLVVRMRGDLDRAALAAALVDLADRHEVLRTVYPAVQGEPVQHVSARPPELEVVTCQEDGLAAMLSAAVDRGFDLTADLPVRATLFAPAPRNTCWRWCSITSPATRGPGSPCSPTWPRRTAPGPRAGHRGGSRFR